MSVVNPFLLAFEIADLASIESAGVYLFDVLIAYTFLLKLCTAYIARVRLSIGMLFFSGGAQATTPNWLRKGNNCTVTFVFSFVELLHKRRTRSCEFHRFHITKAQNTNLLTRFQIRPSILDNTKCVYNLDAVAKKCLRMCKLAATD